MHLRISFRINELRMPAGAPACWHGICNVSGEEGSRPMTVVITSTTHKKNGAEVTIRVEGHLRKEDTRELRIAFEEARTLIHLDLSGLRGFDREAIEAVLELVDAGADVIAAPRYLQLLLERRGTPEAKV